MWRENIPSRESTKGIQVKRWYDKNEILNNIEKRQLLFTATNRRPERFFFFPRFLPVVWWTPINRYHGFYALAKRRFFPRFWSTRRKMSAFKLFLQYYFATDLTSLQILANKSGCVQTNLFFCIYLFIFLYTISDHLRRKSTIRRCFYHTDRVQNAVFHNFSSQLCSFNIQDHLSTRGLLISETVQKISKITYTASRF